MLDPRAADELERLGKELRILGDKEFRSSVYRGLSRAVKPLREVAKKTPHLIPGLPKRGGLADVVARGIRGRGGVKSRRALSGRNVGISISVTSAGHDIAAMDRGRLRHPVWGRQRGIWVNQTTQPGFFTKPMTEAAPDARKQVAEEIDRAFRTIRG